MMPTNTCGIISFFEVFYTFSLKTYPRIKRLTENRFSSVAMIYCIMFLGLINALQLEALSRYTVMCTSPTTYC